jgi:hypothetical protein
MTGCERQQLQLTEWKLLENGKHFILRSSVIFFIKYYCENRAVEDNVYLEGWKLDANFYTEILK